MDRVLRVRASKTASPPWNKLVRNICQWASWVIAKFDQSEAGWQTMEATQHELVPMHDDGEAAQHAAGAEGGKICVAACGWFMCRGCHVEDARQE